MRHSVVAGVALLDLSRFAVAEPPSCETKQVNGTEYETCSRPDITCRALAEEQVKHPSGQWNGCAMPVIITRGSYTVVGLSMYDTSIIIVPHFKDSEKFDIQVIFEKSYCGAKVHEFKDQQIAIHDGVPYARAALTCLQRPDEVPTVVATEKGGTKRLLTIIDKPAIFPAYVVTFGSKLTGWSRSTTHIAYSQSKISPPPTRTAAPRCTPCTDMAVPFAKAEAPITDE